MARRKIDNTEEIEQLIKDHNITVPKDFYELPEGVRLEFIASRILQNSRTTTSHNEMKEEGWLSPSQYQRRLNREVFSQYGSLDEIPATPGVFSRKYRKPKPIK
jgi:hypothetical protein